jgi:hypothetical protein
MLLRVTRKSGCSPHDRVESRPLPSIFDVILPSQATNLRREFRVGKRKNMIRE